MALIKSNGTTFRSLFSDLFDREMMSGISREETMPAVNVRENGDHYLIEVAAPGAGKNDFDISVENHVLNISMEKKQESQKKDEEGNFIRREFRYSSFNRSFTLPEDVKDEDITANYQDGILKVKVKKTEEQRKKSRKIEIS